MIFTVKISLAAALFIAMIPAAVQAESRDVVVSAPMIPYVYRYSACLFDDETLSANERISKCRMVRTSVESEADQVFSQWLRMDRPRSDRMFNRALNLLEDEARYAETNRDPVPQSVISYLDCVGTRLSADPSFIQGTSLEFPLVDKDCRDVNKGDSLDGRARTLLSRLDFDHRVIRSVSGRMPTITFRYGLLAPRRF